MRLHYIVDRDVWSQNLHLFVESHYIPTDDPNKILVAIKFSHEAHADAWESIPGVELLHPDHYKVLGSIGAQRGDLKEHIIQKAGEKHRLLHQERI